MYKGDLLPQHETIEVKCSQIYKTQTMELEITNKSYKDNIISTVWIWTQCLPLRISRRLMVVAYDLPGELALMIGMVLFSCDEVDQSIPPNNNQVIVFLLALFRMYCDQSI